MAFLEKLNKLAKNIEDKTGDAIEISKYSATIHTSENQYRDDIKKIGEFYYNFFLNGGQVEPEILPVFESAKAHLEAAEEARKGIEAINAENEAAKAAAKAEREAEKARQQALVEDEPHEEIIEEMAAPEEEAVEQPAITPVDEPVAEQPAPVEIEAPAVCPSCGAAVDTGAKFCGECGYKMEG